LSRTYNPNNDIIKHGKNYDYENFAAREIDWRERLGYPPCTKMVGIKLESINEEAVKEIASQFGKSLKKTIAKQSKGKSKYPAVDFLGPAKSLLYKIKNVYRWQIILKGPASDPLKEIVQEMKTKFTGSLLKKAKVKVKYDIDPINLM
jgi:primosomal protein N' (replication factor Y)